ncbi:MAG: YSIRK-type signal peptide-containing protein [Gemella haemolysans]|uniref:YSIRK-type signal peptide-containing protein n=1 Tax=Gemella haemolysans TaxID=1379 RepID=UPI0026EDD55C|nr:YSIRK-type signal peptide-containing protein [Gemella haemolysans]MBS5319327.1 YSIRK-type signal peptide-containing protein [Gemella haemolysans]
MFSTRKYSIRKVSVGIASVLIGIAAGSLGTAYAHEDTNNVVVTAESNHDVNLEHVNKPVLEEVEKTILAPEIESKHSKQNVSLAPLIEINKVDNLFKSVLEDKIDWNTIDEKEFVNYLFADIKADKKKEQEIKEVWLIKVNELLAVAPNNVNLQKVKAILENSLKSKSLVETEKPKEEKITEDKKENKESVKDETKKENKEPAKEDKKDNKESVKETDKKEGPKGQTVPENKQEVPSKETPKVTSDKTDLSSNKKQETSENNASVENKVLSATLSGRDVAVSFDKNKIKADDVFVGAINDEKLNKTIIEKLGSEYKVIEVFEIHFKKDGKKIDSDAERTVKVSVVKNDNAELEVYHVADNNVLEKVESSFSDGSLQFKINHFSKFTILERIRVGAKDLESRVQIVTPVKVEHKAEHKKEDSDNSNKVNNDKKEETNKKEKEELPKTGLESEQTISVALLALLAAIAVIRKQKQ